MSWDIDLICKECNCSVRVDFHEGEGGTYTLGGTNEAHLNVTYNYGKQVPFKSLDGMGAKFSIRWLQAFIDKLGTKQDEDYWADTPGNAGYACSILLKWAEKYPNATWRVE